MMTDETNFYDTNIFLAFAFALSFPFFTSLFLFFNSPTDGLITLFGYQIDLCCNHGFRRRITTIKENSLPP